MNYRTAFNSGYIKSAFMPLPWHTSRIHKVVGNKAKGRISKRVFQEYKACQIFRKTNISYPLIRTGGKKYSLFGKFDVFWFLETPVLRFALLPYYRRCVFHPNCNKVSHSCSVFIFKLAHDCVLFNEVKPNSYTCLRKS